MRETLRQIKEFHFASHTSTIRAKSVAWKYKPEWKSSHINTVLSPKHGNVIYLQTIVQV